MNKFMEDEVVAVAQEDCKLGEVKTKRKEMRVVLKEWMPSMMMDMTRMR